MYTLLTVLIRQLSAFLYILPLLLFFPKILNAAIEDPVRWYVGGKLGYAGVVAQNIQTQLPSGSNSKPYSRFMSTFAVGVVGGLQVRIAPHTHFRAELEYMHRLEVKTRQSYPEDVATNFKLLSHSILTNAYIDYAVIKFVSLYISAGIGISILESDISRNITNASYHSKRVIPNFAWQAGFGTRVEINEYIMADFNLRYIDTGSVPFIGKVGQAPMRAKSTGAFEVLFSVAYLF